MKKYIVYFLEEFGGELSQQKTVLAETKEDALDKYLLENYSEKYRLIMVSPTAFFSTPQVFNNPIYQKKQKEIIEADKKLIDDEESSEDKFSVENKNRSINIQSDKLDKLIELQEKQLFWVRVVGLPILLGMIVVFIRILAGATLR
jgi:hypothetical protein